MALPLRSVRDSVRTDVQNEIQPTNRSGVPASFAGTKNPEGGHLVRRNAINSSQGIKELLYSSPVFSDDVVRADMPVPLEGLESHLGAVRESPAALGT
jgi:hypothetical protein